MTKREFIRVMGEVKAPGSSEPAVYRYLRGEVEPSLAFLQAAALVLGVRAEWLVLEHGEPKATDEADPGPEPHWVAVREALGPYATLGGRRVIDTAYRLAQYNAIQDGGELDTVGAAATVARFVRAALEAAPVGLEGMPEDWTEYNGTDAVTLLLQAYQRLIPTPGEARMMRMIRAARGPGE